MTAKATKSKHPAHTSKSRVPIVNVFDEEEGAATPVAPARRPVVVEIEQAPLPPTPAPTPAAPYTPDASASAYQMPVASTPPPIAPPVEAYQRMSAPAQSPVAVASHEEPAPAVGMQTEPVLPSFFEQDLRTGGQPPAATAVASPTPVTAPETPITPFEVAAPQGVVGELNEMSEEGNGSNKKLIGIVLMVVAIVVLAIGGLFLYARSIFSPVALPTPTPTPVMTPRPVPTVTPTPVASDSGKLSSASAELKKKVKVDVLNGTKVAGLAAKQAAILKAAGYTTGVVGNGKPENAGTIVVAPTYKVLADDIVKLLKDFTFTVKEDAKMTTIQVTLGEQKE